MQRINPSFNLRRSAVSLAVLTAVALTVPAHAQVSVTASQPTLDLNGGNGVTIGPDSTTVIGTVTNSGIDDGGSDADGVDTSAAIRTFDNPTGSTIKGNLYGVNNTGPITTMTNEGTVEAIPTQPGVFNGATGSINTLTNGATGTIVQFENQGSIDAMNNDGLVTAPGPYAAVQNDAGATTTAFTNGPTGEVTSTNADALANDGTMPIVTNNGKILSTHGDGVNSSQPTSFVDTLTNNNLISGSTGVDAGGTFNNLNNTATGAINGTGTAAVVIEPGTSTNVNDAGVIAGTDGSADGLDVNGSGNVSVTGSGSIASTGGVGMSIGAGANARLAMQDTSSVSGSSAGVQDSGDLFLTMSDTSTLSSTNGSALNVLAGASATVSTDRGTTITAAGVAPTIDVAGNAALTLRGTLSNTGTGAALQLESTAQAAIELDGQVQGAINNLSPNALVLTGSSDYTNGNTAGGEQGLLTGVNGEQSVINSVGQDLMLNRNVVLDDTVNLGSNTLSVGAGGNLVAFRQVDVNGNVDVQAGATFTSQVQSADAYGRLMVSGNATTEAGSTVALKPLTAYNPTAGQRFDLISAAGTGSYNTGAITASVDGFNGTVTPSTVTHDGRTDLVVTLSNTSTISTGTGTSTTTTPSNTTTTEPSAPDSTTTTTSPTTTTGTTTTTTPAVADVATSPVARAALNGVLAYTGWTPGLLNTYNAAVAAAATSPAQANAAGAQLAPTSRAVGAGLVRSMADGLASTIGARADSTRNDVSQQWTVWGQGVGGAAQQNGSAGVDGYTMGYGGIVVGADRAVGDRARVGAMLSYVNGSANATGDAGQHVGVNALGLTAYGSYGKTWYVNGSVGVSENEFSESRSVAFPGVNAGASAHFHGEAVTANLETGLPIALAHGVTVTPYAGLSAMYVNQHAYTEGDGGAGVALNVSGASTTDVRSTLGVKVEQAFDTKAGTIEPELRLAYVHDFNGSTPSTTANFVGAGETSFTTVGLSQPANLADLGLGVTVYRARGLSLSARADVQIGAGYKAESVMVQARKAF
ncbi:autotransporter domain-containing protein [Burkholderia sp. LMG 13014]|uniref:autotransporter family protein n=1 Tax=Burkholderia sp. LMG 13014 TaxID=2709306 RepID=UPI0019648B38|nr:autotransporter domain-containing protein [Burkholderia sp. LMG 13014]